MKHRAGDAVGFLRQDKNMIRPFQQTKMDPKKEGKKVKNYINVRRALLERKRSNCETQFVK